MMTDFVEGPVTPLVEAVRQMIEARPPYREPLRMMPLSDHDRLRSRVSALESEVATLKAELDNLRAQVTS